MKVARVPQFQKPGGYVTVEDGATYGAVVGVNLFLPDGSLVTLASLTPTAPTTPSVSSVPWGSVTEKPHSAFTLTLLPLATGQLWMDALGGIGASFETVSKNLKAWDAAFAYTLGVLDTITYTSGALTVVKTFGYTLGKLTSLTLSGDTPGGIDLVKTLSYTGDELTAVAYT